MVSISFDAAWGNEDTQQLIDTLAKYGVKATLSAGDREVTRSTGPLCPWYALWSSMRTTPVTSAQERLS